MIASAICHSWYSSIHGLRRGPNATSLLQGKHSTSGAFSAHFSSGCAKINSDGLLWFAKQQGSGEHGGDKNMEDLWLEKYKQVAAVAAALGGGERNQPRWGLNGGVEECSGVAEVGGANSLPALTWAPNAKDS